MINNLILKYGFGIPLMILITIIYIVIALITYKKHKKILMFSTVIFIIVEIILIYMYTAHQ